MDPVHARYPYFAAAREAVERAEVSLSDLVREGAPAVERATERVERALLEGTTAPADPRAWDVRDELLSYPIARILVSLMDASGAVEKYAMAEAATAGDRLAEDVASDDDLRSTESARVDLRTFLDEFDLGGVRAEPVEGPRAGRGGDERGGRGGGRAGRRGAGGSGRDPAWFRIGVTDYLRLVDADWGPEWRLVRRELAAGEVRVEREELYRLLRRAVYRRVVDGLPFTVRTSPAGEAIADGLADEVASLRDLLSVREEYAVDTVVPALFPPCMKQLLARAQRGGDLPPHSRFAFTAFLVGIGMDTDEVVRLARDTSLDEETIRYQTEYLRDADGTQYPAPSCATMDAYGDCVNRDERCDTISHPMTYYGAALADADDDELRDWRETST
mgnify:CR=1 FL=1